MDRLKPLLRGPDGPALMLDPWDYAALVLDRASPPWHDTAALVALARRAVNLLKPQALLLPLLPWFEAQWAQRRDLVEHMGQRARVPFPLKTALADKDLRQEFAAMVEALCLALPQLPVLPALAEPGQWLSCAWGVAHGAAPDGIDGDMCEQAEVMLADLLREIGAVRIGGLLLDEPQVQADPAWAERHAPVLNAGVHYRWSMGAALVGVSEALPPPLAWTVGAASGALPRGASLGEGFWRGDGPEPADFYLARIPTGLEPETVLARLASLATHSRSRNASHPAPPSQIRTCGATAYGSCLGS